MRSIKNSNAQNVGFSLTDTFVIDAGVKGGKVEAVQNINFSSMDLANVNLNPDLFVGQDTHGEQKQVASTPTISNKPVWELAPLTREGNTFVTNFDNAEFTAKDLITQLEKEHDITLWIGSPFKSALSEELSGEIRTVADPTKKCTQAKLAQILEENGLVAKEGDEIKSLTQGLLIYLKHLSGETLSSDERDYFKLIKNESGKDFAFIRCGSGSAGFFIRAHGNVYANDHYRSFNRGAASGSVRPVPESKI